MKLRVLSAAGLFLTAGAAGQPAVPGPATTPANWLGPVLLPLIVGTAGLIALIVYVVWRMVVRARRRQGPPWHEGPPPGF